MTLESPGVQQRENGLGAISGWAFSTVPQAQLIVQLYIDGQAIERIPCCVDRADVAAQFPNEPQARQSGFSLVYNFNKLSEGIHSILVVAQDNAGSIVQSQTQTVTVTKTGGYESLSGFAFTSDDDPIFSADHQAFVIKNAEVTDKQSGKTQKVNLTIVWQAERQTLAIVKSENVDDPTEGYDDDDGDGFTDYDDCDDDDKEINPKAQEICDDDIDNDCDGLTDDNDLACKDRSGQRTTIRLELENPSASVVGGIGPISGWTFTTTPNADIRRLQLRVDGNLIGDIPCCSERTDIRDIYPDETDALSTGFGTFVNFNQLDSGDHTFTVEAHNSAGEIQKTEQKAQVVKVGDSTFLDQFDLSTATAQVVSETAVQLENVQIRDQASQQISRVTVGYQWDEKCQCFIPLAGCGNGSIESDEECDGISLDGESCASQGFSGGALLCGPRCTDDHNACERPCLLEFSSCRGGQFIYVTNAVSNSVSVIDTVSDTVANTINVGQNPRGIAISPDGSVAYVTNLVDNTVSILDITSQRVIDTIAVGKGPLGVSFSPDGKNAYVVNGLNRSVSFIDTATRRMTKTVKVGKEPQAIAVTRDGRAAYVTNYKSNSVSELDLQTGRVTATIFVGRGPNGIAVTPDDRKVYAVNYESGSASIIDRASRKVTNTLAVGISPAKIAFAPDEDKAYVTNTIGSTISVIDTKDEEIDSSLPAGSGDNPIHRPDGILLTQGGTRIYVALFGQGLGNTVQVNSTVTGKAVRTITVGEGPIAMAATPGVR